jgi:membrane protein required for colicin V production
LNSFDIALGLIIIFGAYQGYRKGFLIELLTFIGIILGILGGFKLLGIAMILLSEEFSINKKILPYIAFAIVFIGIVILVSLLGRMLKATINKSILGRVDEAAGAFFGILKMAFILSVTLWLIDSLKFEIPLSWTENSKLHSIIAGFAPQVTCWIGEIIPAFKDIF